MLLALGPASLVKDINSTVNESSNPSAFVPLNGRTLFRADDGVHGAEWFSTDGTAAGTALLRDIIPGWSDTTPDILNRGAPVVIGGTMLFSALEPSTGYELWKTDGTPAGTTRVKDIRPGPDSSLPQQLTVVGNLVYFTASDGAHGFELWKSDGTEAGTQMVADLSAQTALWDMTVPLAALGDRLVFAGPGPDTDASTLTSEPWVTDGTAAGTVMLRNINTAGPSMPGFIGQQGPVDVAVVNGTMYFAATSTANGRELWQTDGTPAGTRLVTDLTPSGSTTPRNLIEVGGTVYFTNDPAPGSISTATRIVYRTDPVAGAVELGRLGLNATATVGNVGGVFYVLGLANGKVSLFKNDPAAPAATGLVRVKELAAATEVTPWLGRIAEDDGAALFLAQAATGENGVRLWRSDGTGPGTVEVVRFDVSPNGQRFSPVDGDAWILTRGAGGLFYFAGYDPANGLEPYRTDGTAAGTYRILDLNRDTRGAVDSGVVWLDGPAGGRGLFAASEPEHGQELWATDGTEAGTFLLKDVDPGPSSGLSFQKLFSPALNGRIFFQGSTAATGIELWTSDGTAAGTHLVKEMAPGAAEDRPEGFTPFRGKMYFRTDSGRGGMWVTDGTADGTRIVIPLEQGAALYRMHVAGDWMYYWVRRANGESQLWKTDGTDAGNTLVKVISADPAVFPFGNFDPVVPVGGVLYFAVKDTTSRASLWRTDGTPAGTTLVKSFTAQVPTVVRAGDKLLLAVGVREAQRLWLSDGTPAGTVPIGQVVPPLASWVPPANVLGALVATTGDGAAAVFAPGPGGSAELWRTDGTHAGTRKLSTFQRSGGLRIRGFGVLDGHWYFNVLEPGYGVSWELWRTDGSEAGTQMLQRFADVGPTAQTTEPNVSSGGGRIFFNADDGTHGAELWSMPYAATTTVAGRRVFYNNSAFDGRDRAATTADLAAVATNKSALLPGSAATFDNVTNYDKGINGVLVDLAGAEGAALTADDFDFRVGRTGNPDTWALAPRPTSVVALPSPAGAAVGRYAITWADGAIRDTWLRVTVRANERTGLVSPDAFFFGNLVGEIGDAPANGALRVTVRDVMSIRRRGNLPAAVTSVVDVNRDGTFNAADIVVVRRNLLHSLPLLSAPAPAVVAAAQRAASTRAPAARRGLFAEAAGSVTADVSDARGVLQ